MVTADNFILQTGDFICLIYKDGKIILADMLNKNDMIGFINGFMGRDCGCGAANGSFF